MTKDIIQAIIIVPIAIAMVVGVWRQIGSKARFEEVERRLTAVEDRQRREWDR